MLKHAFTLIVCTVAVAHASSEPLDRRLVGTWVSVDPLPPMYMTFYRDHTRITRYTDGSPSIRVTWRTRGDQLIEQWSSGRTDTIDRCTPVFRGDRVWFGMHQMTVHGKAAGSPELWTTGLTFRRLR
jgi:hypothetical protein